jgi:hypothetical protein
MDTKKILSEFPLGGTMYSPGMETALELVITHEQAGSLTEQGALEGFALEGVAKSRAGSDAATGESESPTSEDLMKMTKAQLLEKADGLDGVSESRTKAEIVEILTGE